MAKHNITMVRGDTLAFGVEFNGLNQPLDSAFFTMKVLADDTEFVFQKTLGDGITLAEANKYRVRVAPEDTADVPAGTYYYDLQIGVNADVYTILLGDLNLLQDVTF